MATRNNASILRHRTTTCYTSIHIRSDSWVSSAIHHSSTSTTRLLPIHSSLQVYTMPVQVATPQQQAPPPPPPPRTPDTARFTPGSLPRPNGPPPPRTPVPPATGGSSPGAPPRPNGPPPQGTPRPTVGLLYRQVLHHPDLVLVAELVLLVVPLPYPTLLLDLLLDLQGGPQEASSLTPEDNLALFPVQGSTFPMTCWLRPTLLLDPVSLLALSSLVVCQSRCAQLPTRQ